jgi:hypothetical protein
MFDILIIFTVASSSRQPFESRTHKMEATTCWRQMPHTQACGLLVTFQKKSLFVYEMAVSVLDMIRSWQFVSSLCISLLTPKLNVW